jgi:hypothetical protein
VKRNLDALRDGFEQLGVCQSELTQDAIDAVAKAAKVRDYELSQLRAMQELAGIEDGASLIGEQLSADRPWRGARELEPAVERIRARYVEVRKGLLNKQGSEAAAAESRVKTRPGFADLDADQAHRVLKPIAEALVTTTAEALAPTLVEVRDRFASCIRNAEEAAVDRLDEERSKVTPDAPIVKVETHMHGREVASREQLTAVLKELEERIGPLVDKNIRVRIV